MIRQLITIFILSLLVIQTFEQGVIVIDYYTNTSSFVRHCINKAKPAMHCNGKCQMSKKLNEETQQDQQAPSRKTEIVPQVVSSKSFFAAAPSATFTSIIPAYRRIREGKPTDYASSLFRPPITA